MKIKYISFLHIYIFFATMYGGINLYYGWDHKLNYYTPFILIILRDFVWMGFIGISMMFFLIQKRIVISSYIIGYTTFAIIFLGISVVHFSHDLEDTIHHNIRNLFIYSLIIPILPLYIKNIKDVEQIRDLIIKLGVIVGIIGIITYILGESYLWGGRVLGTMFNPNTLGVFLNLVIAFLISKSLYNGVNKLTFLSNFIILCIAILLTGSFQNYLMLFFILFYFFISNKGLNRKIKTYIKYNKKIFGWIFFIFIVGGSVIIFTWEPVIHMIEERFTNNLISGVGTGISGRVLNYVNLLNFFERANILEILIGDLQTDRYLKYDSQYLQILRNAGLFGLILMIAIFINIIILAQKTKKYFISVGYINAASICEGIIIFILAYLLIGFNLTAYLYRFPVNFFTFLICAVVLMLAYFAKVDKVKNSQVIEKNI